MKWNEEIRPKDRVYSEDLAIKLIGKYTPHELSLMKHENIRMAIKEKLSPTTIKECTFEACGYCFKNSDKCEDCKLYAKMGFECWYLDEFSNMENACTIDAFAIFHKEWCEQLGLWQEDWE